MRKLSASILIVLATGISRIGCICRNLRRNCKTLLTVALCVHYLEINQDHTKQRSVERRAMNSLQFQLRMQLCEQLRDQGLNTLDLQLSGNLIVCLQLYDDCMHSL